MIKAVVFDLDDTLISETHYQTSARSAVLNHLAELTGISIEEITAESKIAAAGPRERYFQSLLPKLGMEASPEAVSNLINVHRGHRPLISWYPDVLESLYGLRSLGMKLGIITDGYSVAQHQKLLAVEASTHFDAIVVSDDLGREFWKPHQKTFFKIAEELNVEPEELMYVGDNPEKDFYISHSLPITTVRIRREDALKADRAYHGNITEDYWVDSLQDLVGLCKRLNNEIQ